MVACLASFWNSGLCTHSAQHASLRRLPDRADWSLLLKECVVGTLVGLLLLLWPVSIVVPGHRKNLILMDDCSFPVSLLWCTMCQLVCNHKL